MSARLRSASGSTIPLRRFTTSARVRKPDVREAIRDASVGGEFLGIAETAKGAAGMVQGPGMMDEGSIRDRIRSRIAQHDLLHPTSAYIRHPLTDTHARHHTYLRISLTERCNLRCTYCMPAEGLSDLTPKSEILTDSEIIQLGRLFVQQGVNKIRLTGGEPTLRAGLPNIISGLAALRPEGLGTIGMTSNGIALNRKLGDLVQRGLTHLNLSLDTLDEFKFELVTRRRGHSAVLSTLDRAFTLLRSTPSSISSPAPLPTSSIYSTPSLHAIKLNVVLTRGFNLDELLDFVKLTKEREMSVRFIEFMPFSGNRWDKKKMVPYDEALGILKREYGSDLVQVQDTDGDGTSKRWKVKEWKGEVGFISSMSDHFCGTCNRLRITADGNLKVCLFDNAEVSLRDLMRNPISLSSAEHERDLLALVGAAVGDKKARHAGMDLLKGMQNRSMDENRRWFQSRGRISRIRSTGSCSEPLVTAIRTPLGIRAYSTNSSGFTHLDSKGRANMVSISAKASTVRRATAIGKIWLPDRAFNALTSKGKGGFAKGDVLGTARIAGIMAAKRTGEIIPLCHPLGLTDVKVGFQLVLDESGGWVKVRVTTECEGKTGVEMEALTAASTALLTVWDMVKAVCGKEMRIEGLMVVHKEGGKSGDWIRAGEENEIGDDKYNE